MKKELLEERKRSYRKETLRLSTKNRVSLGLARNKQVDIIKKYKKNERRNCKWFFKNNTLISQLNSKTIKQTLSPIDVQFFVDSSYIPADQNFQQFLKNSIGLCNIKSISKKNNILNRTFVLTPCKQINSGHDNKLTRIESTIKLERTFEQSKNTKVIRSYANSFSNIFTKNMEENYYSVEENEKTTEDSIFDVKTYLSDANDDDFDPSGQSDSSDLPQNKSKKTLLCISNQKFCTNFKEQITKKDETTITCNKNIKYFYSDNYNSIEKKKNNLNATINKRSKNKSLIYNFDENHRIIFKKNKSLNYHIFTCEKTYERGSNLSWPDLRHHVCQNQNELPSKYVKFEKKYSKDETTMLYLKHNIPLHTTLYRNLINNKMPLENVFSQVKSSNSININTKKTQMKKKLSKIFLQRSYSCTAFELHRQKFDEIELEKYFQKSKSVSKLYGECPRLWSEESSKKFINQHDINFMVRVNCSEIKYECFRQEKSGDTFIIYYQSMNIHFCDFNFFTR